ncbi:zinc metalloprotease [Methylorubrum extorquens]
MRNAVSQSCMLIGIAVSCYAATPGYARAHSIDDGSFISHVAPLPPNISEQYPSPDTAVKHVIDQYKIWKTGTNLNICFFGGERQLRKFVAETAQTWVQNGNLRLNFGHGDEFRDCTSSQPSHIRISFSPAGNWSYVGTDSVRTNLAEPSMNLGIASGVPFSVADKQELRGVILHEFGHAFGLQHEHQSPKSGCEARFNWSVVYQRLGGPPNNWNKNTVDLNLRALLSSKRLRVSEYDRLSVMHYSLPSWMFIEGQRSPCFVPPNHTLSPMDVAGFAKAYPKTDKEQYVYLDSLDSTTRDVLQERNVNGILAKQIANTVIDLIKNDFPSKSITVCAREGAVAVGVNVKNSEIRAKAEVDTDGVCPQGAGVVGSGGGIAIGGSVEGSRICAGGTHCAPAKE